jgi:large subunit ribosomal protein L18
MDRNKEKKRKRLRRHLRARKRVFGTAEVPRLCVYRSLNNIYCQLIDDLKKHTLAAASTLDKDLHETLPKRGNKPAAQAAGKKIAERAKALGIKKICFDRGGYKYHGRVKALSDAAREAGLVF